jgi:hypothetical protein
MGAMRSALPAPLSSLFLLASIAGCAAPPLAVVNAPASSSAEPPRSAPAAIVSATASPRVEPDGAPRCDAAAPPTMLDLRATEEAGVVHFTVSAYFNLPVTPTVTQVGRELRVEVLNTARVPDCHGEVACLEAHPLPYCSIPFRVVGASTARPLTVAVDLRVPGEEGRASVRVRVP